MRSGRVELRIEELVLEGFAPGDRHGIGDAIQVELARLLAEQGLPPWLVGASGVGSAGDETDWSAAPIAVAPNSSAAAIGNQVAQAVYGARRRYPSVRRNQ
jgi:hypothetical protein